MLTHPQPLVARRALAALALMAAPALAQDTPVARMQAAFARADVAAAEAAARDVLAADTAIERRRQAFAMLGNLASRIHRDSTAAQKWLTQATTLETRRATSYAMRARSEIAFGNYAAAAADARAARAVATTPAERTQAVVAAARVVLDPLLAGGTDTTGISTSVRDLAALVAGAPGDIAPAQLLVIMGAMAHNGPAVLAGWRSYYLALTNGGGTRILAPARDVLTRVLPTWPSSGDTPATRTVVVHALADSRFFEAAAWLAGERARDGTTIASKDDRAREIVAYGEFLRGARRVTNEFYRLTALTQARDPEWRDSLSALAHVAWPAFAWHGAAPSFSWKAFLKEAGTRFGVITPGFGNTGGFIDMHYGHAVDDQRHSVTQYGHTAAFRFVQLDAMLSNGYLSWFWDGTSADGGWQNDEMVVQVRPSYASGPIQSWTARTDTTVRRLSNAAIATDSIADLARARATPVAFFPSVADRLTRAAELGLLDSLRRSGLAGDGLRAKFVETLSDETQEYSIFQHEGRHAIDNARTKGLKGSELEFTAKLSQVVFAPRPELAVSSIMAPNLGNDTPHGIANERIMRGVVDWMSKHEGEIAHLDRTAPLLPQLPLLTSAQLRAVFRSLDPLAPPK